MFKFKYGKIIFIKNFNCNDKYYKKICFSCVLKMTSNNTQPRRPLFHEILYIYICISQKHPLFMSLNQNIFFNFSLKTNGTVRRMYSIFFTVHSFILL